MLVCLLAVASEFFAGCGGSDEKESLKNSLTQTLQQISVTRVPLVDQGADEVPQRTASHYGGLLFAIHNGTDWVIQEIFIELTCRTTNPNAVPDCIGPLSAIAEESREVSNPARSQTMGSEYASYKFLAVPIVARSNWEFKILGQGRHQAN